MRICLACGLDLPATHGWTCSTCHWAPACGHPWPLFAPALADGGEGFSPELFAKLARLEPAHFWFRSRNRLLVWALRKYFGDARSLLEIGCGTGFVLAGIHDALPLLSVAGSEVFNEGLAIARSRLADVPLFQMDARHIPFESEFDVVGAFDVLEHIDEDETVLGQMFQAVRPGGGVLLTVPQHQFLWSGTDEYASHKRRYSRSDLVTKVERAGFDVLRVTSFVTALLPLVFVSRMIGQRRRPVSLEAFDVHPVTNVLCERILAFERLLIAGGLSFPAGVSLLVAARRPGATIR